MNFLIKITILPHNIGWGIFLNQIIFYVYRMWLAEFNLEWKPMYACNLSLLDVSLPYGTSGRINHYFQFYYICNLRFSIYSIKRTSIDIESLYLGVLILIIHIISYLTYKFWYLIKKISSGRKVELDGGKSKEKWLFIFCCISNNLATASSIKKQR